MLFCGSEINAQESLTMPKDADIERVDWLKVIADKFISQKKTEISDVFPEFEEFTKEKQISSNTEILFLRGYCYILKNDNVNAIRFLLQAKEAEDIRKNQHLELEIYLQLANAYQRLFYLQKSIYYYQKLLFKNNNILDKKLHTRIIMNIGNSYYELNDTLLALKYYKDAYQYACNQKDTVNIITGLLNLSNVYMDMKKYKDCGDNIDLAFELSIKLNTDQLKAMCYFNYGELYQLKKDYLLSSQNFTKSAALFQGGKLDRLLPEIFKYLVQVNYEVKNYDNVLEYCKKFQDQANKYIIQEKQLRAIKAVNEVLLKLEFLPKTQSLLNNNNRLLEDILLKEIAAKKSLTESLRELAELEKSNRNLDKKNQVNQERLKVLYTIISLILMTLVINSIALINFVKSRNKIRKQNILINKQFEDIQAINADAELLVQQKEKQTEEILSQNEQLSRYQNKLEEIIEERTVELSSALIKAKESDSLKMYFLQNISHEIRTPLNAISGFSQLLAIDDSKNEEYIEIINQSVAELLKIVDNIIVFAKLQANQLPLNFRAFPIGKLYQTVSYESEQIRKKYDSKPISLICKNQLPPEFLIYSDFSFLSKILIQLVENAFKFTEQGEIIISCEEKDNKLHFYVNDSGIGIRPDKLPYIFDPFRKIEGQQKIFRGTGIGLSLVDKLIQLLKGKLSIESEYGVGTKITFEIPFKQEV